MAGDRGSKAFSMNRFWTCSVRLCSRLLVNPAHDASEWRLPRGVCAEKDGLPCYLGNGDTGTSLGNPDIQVPYRTKREDGLHLEEDAEDAEDAETTGRKENEEDTKDEERKEDDDGRRNGNSVVPTEAADQRGTERNGDTRADRHAPGGTWLTKLKFAREINLGAQQGHHCIFGVTKVPWPGLESEATVGQAMCGKQDNEEATVAEPVWG
ncbi:hypothetical protein NDU88_004895 [Pleurodeles waltl]|uniref:Uncharacterized protein n=1 Tax=Pleurodeles waltl TaxID=8319 RepID=A0AAV7VHI8_PLEWA|nr:hypothetical protein NDU88_004895 [Pleurodeles waltl]